MLPYKLKNFRNRAASETSETKILQNTEFFFYNNEKTVIASKNYQYICPVFHRNELTIKI